MGSFTFINLNDDIKNLMNQEIEKDIQEDNFYLSERLNDEGKKVYKDLLVKSIEEGDEELFEKDLDINKYFNPTYPRQGKLVKTPVNAAKLLTQCEFNRYYIRAICLKALESGQNEVEVYRARQSSWSRPESGAKIGQKLRVEELILDLRNSVGKEPKVLPEVNSGLSVKL